MEKQYDHKVKGRSQCYQGGQESLVHYSKSQSELCQNRAWRWRPDLLGGMTGGCDAAEETGEEAGTQGAGTMAAGTGGSCGTGKTSCTGS